MRVRPHCGMRFFPAGPPGDTRALSFFPLPEVATSGRQVFSVIRWERSVTTQGPMAEAVAAALREAELRPEDGGAQALACRYAALIDEAVPLAKYDKPLRALRQAVRECSDPGAEDHLAKIEAALSAHSVASDLGPKLLAVLTALSMTAAGRSTKGGAGGGVGPVSPVASKLDELRARRQQRSG